MRVIAKAQGTFSHCADMPPEPVEIRYYRGDNGVEALDAMVTAVADAMRKAPHHKILSVTIEMDD
jgi:hypothetical protein